MADLRVTVAGVNFSNPLIAASGTFGFGREYNELYSLSVLGGISSKGITLKERLGNPSPRIAEANGCMLNAIGLQNPGVDYFIEYDLPWLKQQNITVIANIAGNTPEEYCAMAEKLSDTNVDMLEMNISCPNVKEGGVHFGTSCMGVFFFFGFWILTLFVPVLLLKAASFASVLTWPIIILMLSSSLIWVFSANYFFTLTVNPFTINFIFVYIGLYSHKL